MYEQVFDPVSDSLGLSTIFAALPLISLFVLLGGFRVTAWLAGLISLGVAIAVAVIVYGVPFGQSLDMGAEGAAFGLFPIMWIVINAIWIYNMTEFTGHFAVLRRSFATISDDTADPGRDHRLLLRRPDRGPGGIRDPGRDHLRDAARARLQAAQGSGALADRQHGPGGLRLDRDPDRHPRLADRAAAR